MRKTVWSKDRSRKKRQQPYLEHVRRLFNMNRVALPEGGQMILRPFHSASARGTGDTRCHQFTNGLLKKRYDRKEVGGNPTSFLNLTGTRL